MFPKVIILKRKSKMSNNTINKQQWAQLVDEVSLYASKHDLFWEEAYNMIVPKWKREAVNKLFNIQRDEQ